MSSIPVPATADAWDQARQSFAKSILVDTPLASLAQDLDVPPWPVNAPDETPAAYIYLPHSQAVAALSARGLPPSQLASLITILNETNAFDQPFGDMMDDIAATPPGAVDEDSPLIKNLTKLSLPEDFPLEFSALTEGTIALCRNENISTLGSFVGFSSRLAQSVIVGGDFRALLNALAQRDEASLARLLPLRAGAPGLHLVEAVALTVRTLTTSERAAIDATPSVVPPVVTARVARLVAYFKVEHATARDAVATGAAMDRVVSVLSDPPLEKTVALLLRPHMPGPVVAAPAPAPKKKPSFFARLFGRG